VHHEFIPPGQSVTDHFYVQVLQRLYNAFQRMQHGRDSGFCITVSQDATHRLLYINSSPRITFLSSPNHHILQILPGVNFGCSLLRKWSRGDMFCNHGGHQISHSGRFQRKSSAGTSNNGRINGTCVCVRARARILL
jgi:hypothetical protein